MSLIQEALKRQQEELNAEKRGEEPQEPTPPQQTETENEIEQPAEAETPTASPAEKRKMTISSRKNAEEAVSDDDQNTEEEEPVRRTSEKEQRVIGPLLTVIIILVILIGVVGWAALYGYRMLTTEKPDSEGPDVVEVQPPAPEPVADPNASPDDPTDLAQAGTSNTEPTPVQIVQDPITTDPESGNPSNEGNVADTGSQQGTDPDQPTGTTEPVAATSGNQKVDPQSQKTPAETTKPPPAPEPIIWPEVVVSGVIGAGENGSAIINGEVIGKNEMVDGITVREFGKGFVLLEYQGETRKFSVGRPLR